MIIPKIISYGGKFYKNIWLPFKNSFYITLGAYSGYEFRDLLFIQDSGIISDEIRITKFQAFIWWIYNLNIWHYFSIIINNISYVIGLSKNIVLIIILLIIVSLIIKIFYYILSFIRPKKQQAQAENEKKGLELLKKWMTAPNIQTSQLEQKTTNLNKSNFGISKEMEQQKVIFHLENEIRNLNEFITNHIKNKNK